MKEEILWALASKYVLILVISLTTLCYHLVLRDFHFPSCNCLLTIPPVSTHFAPTDYYQDQMYKNLLADNISVLRVSGLTHSIIVHVKRYREGKKPMKNS